MGHLVVNLASQTISRELLDVALQLVALEDVEAAVLGDGGDLHVGVVQLLLHDLLQDGQRVLDGLLQRHRLVVDLLQVGLAKISQLN